MERKNEIVKDKSKKIRNKSWVKFFDVFFGTLVTIGIGIFVLLQGSFLYEYFTYAPNPENTIQLDGKGIAIIAMFITSIIFAIILFVQFIAYSILTIVSAICKRWHLPYFTITHALLTFLNLVVFLFTFIYLLINGNIG